MRVYIHPTGLVAHVSFPNEDDVGVGEARHGPDSLNVRREEHVKLVLSPTRPLTNAPHVKKALLLAESVALIFSTLQLLASKKLTLFSSLEQTHVGKRLLSMHVFASVSSKAVYLLVALDRQ